MPRRDPLQEQVELVSQAARDPRSAESVALFRRALRARQNLPAARAAQAAGEHGLSELVPDLVASFSCFMEQAVKRDPRCAAKIAIAEALDRLDYPEPALFLQGLRHIQLEPVWGGTTDTAAPLRARCMAALVRLNHPDRYRFLADLLFDACPDARRGAVHAAAYAGGEAGELLLRIKVHLGDEDRSIISDCFSGLIQLAPDSALDFLGRYLQSDDGEIRELAALALGESHLLGALDLLRRAIQDSSIAGEIKVFALAIGLCRTDEAFELLLELLATRPTPLAMAVMDGLSLCASDPARRRRLAGIAHSRGFKMEKGRA
ncbi:MAG: HEAT repeat domain-containing protein [Acidobacteria bacterium]|nr:MAG: HEAT repeat domain-containing protein [Acidobacteriota bacterium]